MTQPLVTEISSESQWHSLRSKYLGASEIGALFDVSPWTTRFTLWHTKAGVIPYSPPEGDMRMNIGKRIEPFIAELVADRLNLDVRRSKVYWSLPDEKIGCTLDFEFSDPEFGPAIVETKNVDYFQFKDGWGETRPPLVYQLQVQHQLAVTGCNRAVLAAFVGGNDLKLYDIRPQLDVIAEIKARAAAFWKSIADKQQPDPTGTDDELRILARLYPDLRAEPPITLDSHEVQQACADLLWGQAQVRGGGAMVDKAKAVLLNAMGDSGHALAPGHRIRVTRSTNKNGVVSTRMTVTESDTGIIVKPDDVRPFG